LRALAIAKLHILEDAVSHGTRLAHFIVLEKRQVIVADLVKIAKPHLAATSDTLATL